MIARVSRPALVIFPVLVGLLPLVLLGGVGLLVTFGSLLAWGWRRGSGNVRGECFVSSVTFWS